MNEKLKSYSWNDMKFEFGKWETTFKDDAIKRTATHKAIRAYLHAHGMKQACDLSPAQRIHFVAFMRNLIIEFNENQLGER